MARPSLLDNEPYLAELIAELYLDGKTNQEIADALGRGVHKDTVTDYRRDPRVRKIIRRLSEEREALITRRVDRVILERLKNAEEIDTETLLKIRKEMMPKRIEVSGEVSHADLVRELWEAADSNPELAATLMALGAGDDDE